MTALIRVALAAALVRPAAGLAQVVPRAKIVPTDLGSFPPSRNFPAPGSTNSRGSATNTPDAALSDVARASQAAERAVYQFASPAVYLQDEESSYSAALASIQRLEADMSDLDTVTTEPQLTKGEIGILFVSAIGAALAPLLVSEKVVELGEEGVKF